MTIQDLQFQNWLLDPVNKIKLKSAVLSYYHVGRSKSLVGKKFSIHKMKEKFLSFNQNKK